MKTPGRAKGTQEKVRHRHPHAYANILKIKPQFHLFALITVCQTTIRLGVLVKNHVTVMKNTHTQSVNRIWVIVSDNKLRTQYTPKHSKEYVNESADSP